MNRDKVGFIAYQVISWAMIALCALMIHGFSLQDAERSGALSLEVADVAARLVQPEGDIDRTAPSYLRLHTLVRKGAHALEYALLALSTLMVLAPLRMKLWKKTALALILCAAFAGFDEWTQAGSEGRSPAALDVAIDALGALAGCFAALATRRMVIWALRSREMRTR